MPICASAAKAPGPQGAAWGTGSFIVGQSPADQVQTDLTQCQLVLFTGKEWQTSQFLANAAPQDVDPALAGSYFALAFVSTVTLWASVHGIGRVLSFLKRG